MGEGYSTLKGRLFAAFLPFGILLESGADLHMPWWLMLIVAGIVVAIVRGRLLALRDDRTVLALAIGLGTAYFFAWQLGCWLGENGAETLHKPWRWWLMAVVLSAGIEAMAPETGRG